jgi:hypothetical protein
MPGPVVDGRRTDLRADCARCAGLCCVAPAFAASADFGLDKPAGKPCPNLQADFRCGIHDRLRPQGFGGCVVFDCFGAGQKVVQVTFGGKDWRQTPGLARPMFDAFTVMRHLHELLWYLNEALTLQGAGPLHTELTAAFEETERLTHHEPETLVAVDVAAHRGEVNALLVRASELARAGAGRRRLDRRGADLAGKDLRRTDLRGANLRGALLLGADLRGADLTLADLTGADVRGADVRGADLGEGLFVTQSQLESARGDATTAVPPALTQPGHWTLPVTL